MKNLFLIFLFFFGRIFSPLDAQNTQLDYYTFGEGLNFVNENDSRLTLRGYIQPYFDFKIYSDTLGNTFSSDQMIEPAYRARLRRLRLRR